MKTQQSDNSPKKKEWPMSWIAVVIVISLVSYTVVTLTFRKPSSDSHLPYEESQKKNKAFLQPNVLGWARLLTSIQSSSNEKAALTDSISISTSPTPSKLETILPMDLVMVMSGRPRLLTSIENLQAPANIQHGDSILLSFRLPSTTSSETFYALDAYVKGADLHLFPQKADTLANPNSNTEKQIAISPSDSPLTSGTYNVHLYTAKTIHTWELQVIENSKTPSIDLPTK
jgi:hypothetical protein